MRGPFQASSLGCSLRPATTVRVVMTKISERKKKLVETYIEPKIYFFLIFLKIIFFWGGTVSATSAASSLRVPTGTAVLEGIENPRASNALKPHLMIQRSASALFFWMNTRHWTKSNLVVTSWLFPGLQWNGGLWFFGNNAWQVRTIIKVKCSCQILKWIHIQSTSKHICWMINQFGVHSWKLSWCLSGVGM